MKTTIKKLSVLFAAAAMMTSCSNDELNLGNGNVDGDTNAKDVTAYLKVNIKDASNMLSRAEDGGYVNGDENEHAITNAKFYFFDANGIFVQEATVWNGGKDNGNHGTTGNNIEYIGDNVLVLKGLTTNTYPNYMLTVLNVPEDFQPTHGMSIDDVRNTLVGIYDKEGEDAKFVMSTSSYYQNDTNHKYGTNKLTKSDFMVLPAGQATSDINVNEMTTVNVYVERLAAKIDVNFAATTMNDDGYYPIKVSVAGNANDEGRDEEGLTEIYIQFSKWGISGTTPNSYMTKNISNFKNSSTPFNGWNMPTFYRSFWGKSVVYDKENFTLNHLTFDKTNIEFGKAGYCNENTNTISSITDEDGNLIGKNVTSVIFTAQLFEKVKNNDTEEYEYKELDLVRFKGELYRKTDFLAYVLDNLNIQNKLNYYKLVNTTTSEDGVTTNNYEQLNAEELALDFELKEGAGTGVIYVTSNLEVSDDKYYVKSEDGKHYEEVAWTEEAISTLKDNLAKFYNANSEQSIANAYEGGKMFYTVPVEHLVEINNDGLVEGNYGVVRNHWYHITVNKIASIGHGVFKPGTGEETGEPLIPEDDPKDPTYYLGATINVLSWKVVNQNVNL